jgi:glycosyltransferase involved in cell wall biosynthesis
MRILTIHNRYQLAGGEEVAVSHEADMLTHYGHEVIRYERSNDELNTLTGLQKAAMPLTMTWATQAVQQVKALIAQHRPDIAHIHNTHFMISPAVIRACVAANVPVVQTLHNFRLLCAAATFYRDGHVCEDCLSAHSPLPGVMHGCFRASRSQTLALTAGTATHRLLGTWASVRTFITPTAFVRDKFVQGGYDPQQITVKPHFLANDPGYDPTPRGRYLLFVGRLSPEKGAHVLLEAWKHLPDIPLKIIGEGPLMADAQAILAAYPDLPIELCGRVPREVVYDALRGAYALVVPSSCYETFGLSIIEAFAIGTPVIAAGHGAPAELVEDGITGKHFTPNDALSLAEQVRWLWERPAQIQPMGAAGRAAYAARYTMARNYEMLMAIYAGAQG